MLRFKRLRGTELRSFIDVCKKPELPKYYFDMSDCYSLSRRGKIVGGYCITHTPIDEMISMQQIPIEFRKDLGNEDPFKYAEITSFFVSDKKHKKLLMFCLFTHLLVHKATYFVCSYPTCLTELETLLRVGQPLRLYSGKPKLVIGVEGILTPVSVNVELFSKWQLLKIIIKKFFT